MAALVPVTQLPDCAPLPIYDWVELNTDDQVIIRTADGVTAGGQVDVVADDASIFWVWLEGGAGRVAVHEEDDTQVWKATDQVGTPKHQKNSQPRNK